MAETPDYSAYKEEDTGMGDNLLKALRFSADSQTEAEVEIEVLGEELKKAKERLKNISEIEIPNLLEGLTGKFDLHDGRVVHLSEKLRCSIPSRSTNPEGHAKAIKIIADSEHAAILKKEFKIEFGRGKEEDSKLLDAFLKTLTSEPNIKKTTSVHTQTLTAFVKECLAEGIDLPEGAITVHNQRVSKIK